MSDVVPLAASEASTKAGEGDKASVHRPRFLGGLAKRWIDQPQNLEVVGVAAKFGCVRAHVVAVFLHPSNIAARRDHRIRVLGGEGAAARRATGLDEGWPALR